jgi:hypothetical protein
MREGREIKGKGTQTMLSLICCLFLFSGKEDEKKRIGRNPSIYILKINKKLYEIFISRGELELFLIKCRSSPYLLNN